MSALALVNYGHHPAIQVRGGRVRGLGLHLQRLDAATRDPCTSAVSPRRTTGGPPGTTGTTTRCFVTNSIGIAPVRQIDHVTYRVDAELMKTVGQVYESVPWDAI